MERFTSTWLRQGDCRPRVIQFSQGSTFAGQQPSIRRCFRQPQFQDTYLGGIYIVATMMYLIIKDEINKR